MSTRKKLADRLGGHMAASIGGAAEAPPAAGDRRFQGRVRDEQGACIELGKIICAEQPRKEFDDEDLRRLADSLRERGQLQACVVTWEAVQGKYKILAGERRFRAAKLAGLGHLRCVVWDNVDEIDRFELQLIENALRTDLQPMEQALAYSKLKAARSWSDKQLAARLHIHPASVTRALAMIRLPEAVRDSVQRGDLAPATAYEISKAPAGRQEALAAEATAKKLPRHAVAAKVKEARAPSAAAAPAKLSAEIFTSIAPWTWTGSEGVTIRISPRPGARILGIVSIAYELAQALADIELAVEAEVAAKTAKPRKKKAG